MTSTKRERVAQILVEAATLGDKATAEKHGITQRSLQRWRKQLPDDTELSSTVADKKAKVEAGWADEIPGALRAAVTFLRKAAEQADAKSPEAIHAIAGAMKLLSETSATWKVLDARLARQNRQVDGQAGPPAGAGQAAGGPRKLTAVS
jgi:transposase-like protein